MVCFFLLIDIHEEAAEVFLRRRFREMEISMDAFSALEYVGTRTRAPPTDFRGLLLSTKSHLRNINVRAPRKPSVVYKALKVSIYIIYR